MDKEVRRGPPETPKSGQCQSLNCVMHLLGGSHHKITNREQPRKTKRKRNKEKKFSRARQRQYSEAGRLAWGVPCSWGAGLDIPEVREQSPDRM